MQMLGCAFHLLTVLTLVNFKLLHLFPQLSTASEISLSSSTLVTVIAVCSLTSHDLTCPLINQNPICIPACLSFICISTSQNLYKNIHFLNDNH